MMQVEPQCVCPIGAELAEGPVWLAEEAALYFVDIKGQNIHRWHASSDLKTWHLPQPVGFVQPLQSGGLIAGLKDGLYRFSTTAPPECLLSPEPTLPGNRLNDAFTDRDGHLWFGSMDDAEQAPSGALYCVDAMGNAIQKDVGYVITNGPAMSPDGRTLYHTNTLEKTVYAFDVDAGKKLTNKRVFIHIADAYPDGTTVDAAGCLWIAFFGGARVERYSPHGELLQTVPFPCANVTKIAFGGDDLCVAYATTAWKGLSPRQRDAQPLAGGLFSFAVDTPGLPQGKICKGFS